MRIGSQPLMFRKRGTYKMKRNIVTIALTLCFLLALAIGASYAATPWSLSGTHFGPSGCELPDPHVTGEPGAADTCPYFDIFHVEEGFYGDISLDNLDFMAVGIGYLGEEWPIGLYVPEAASPEQVEAIKNIYEELLGAPITLGIKAVPINLEFSGDTYRAEIPGILEIESVLRPDLGSYPGYYGTPWNVAENAVLKYKDDDFGFDWDFAGKSSWHSELSVSSEPAAEEPSDKIVATIPIGLGPFGVTVNPYTRVAITGNHDDGTASVIDLTTLEVIDTIEIGGAPSGPDVNPYTNIAVFANEVVEDAGLGENHVVSIVDLTTGQVKKHIPVGEESLPVCVNIDPVRNIVVVPLSGKNEVLVIDLATEEIIMTIPVGTTPMCMHWCINTYTNQAIVANMGENTLSVLDLEQGVEIQRIPVGTTPVGSSLNPYTNIAVVPNVGSNDVSVVDLSAGQVVATIPVGAEPNCSVIEPTMNLALVSNSASDTVSVISLNTMSVVDTIPVGTYPSCLAIDSATMTALVTNTGSSELTIIDLKKIAVAGEDFSNTFFLSLESGLNMISLPLKPPTPITARDLMNETGSTVVIEYDNSMGRFVGFTQADSGDGFPIQGGKGYIVNVKESMVVPFVGAAWTNEPSVTAAPPADARSTGWAFVVSGALAEHQGADYTVSVRNLRTGSVTTDSVTAGRFDAVFADLNRDPVVEAGDRVEIVIRDSAGKIVAGPVTHQVNSGDIRRAFTDIIVRYGYAMPEKSLLLQNYPNPFNPETWIPFHLAQEADVSVRIYDTGGRLVRTLALGRREAGIYMDRERAAYWDGKSNTGEEVASGVYFYTIQAGEFSSTRKMTVRK
jgi:YVTN family beta-propeller protein